MKKFLEEFKAFALKGNMMDMAIGVLIGGAFSTLVTSLTDNIINPIIGILFQTDFSDVVLHLPFDINLGIGAFISAVINFIILAFVLFCMLKAMNKLMDLGKHEEEKPAEPEAPKAPTQEELLTEESGREFFAGQSWCGVAEDEAGKVLGLYILHPNNVGRCGHICNASYAVSKKARGLHIGEKLVLDCMKEGKKHGFGVLQFNAVVATNLHARHLYERLGFIQLGTIPKGFRMKDGHYEDICPYYKEL